VVLQAITEMEMDSVIISDRKQLISIEKDKEQERGVEDDLPELSDEAGKYLCHTTDQWL